MRDSRLVSVVKIVETPKGDDPVRHDRRMLRPGLRAGDARERIDRTSASRIPTA
jgi:hypothetical protein